LPLAIWGSGYDEFFPRWLAAVHNLNKKPNEIILVTDEKNAHLQEYLKTEIPWKFFVRSENDYRLWDFACRKAKSKWLAFCNADDEFLPTALDAIDEADAQGCNLITDTLIVRQTGHMWSGYWDAETIPHRFTLVGAEPMTLDLYKKSGGFDYRYQFPDWAMAVHMVHKGLAKPFAGRTQRSIFDAGTNRLTMSGQNQDPAVKAAGTAQVHQLARDLGLLN
jgi:hypothetical protein